MTPEKIFEKEMRALLRDLEINYDKLGMRASGNWAEALELRVKSSGFSGTILGEDYTNQLIDGRPPGKFPPIAVIEQWILDKGIRPIDDTIKISSLAFLIARKIANEGTRYFKQGGTDLVSAVITPARIQSIIDKVSNFSTFRFTSELENAFKDFNK